LFRQLNTEKQLIRVYTVCHTSTPWLSAPSVKCRQDSRTDKWQNVRHTLTSWTNGIQCPPRVQMVIKRCLFLPQIDCFRLVYS